MYLLQMEIIQTNSSYYAKHAYILLLLIFLILKLGLARRASFSKLSNTYKIKEFKAHNESKYPFSIRRYGYILSLFW